MFSYGLLPLLVILLSSYSVDPTCSPVREGQSRTLSCNVNTAGCSSGTILSWTAGDRYVAQCRKQGCGSAYRGISATLSGALIIDSVTRTGPFNMEIKWICQSCDSDSITVCDKLEVYSPPQNPSCTVREDTESGDIKSVTFSCSTSKVYPKARCRFYRKKDGGTSVEITNPVYSHPETGDTPVYYRSQCSVSVSVQDLGEGTHSFTGYIYPGVTGDPAKVTGTRADKTVTLSFSQASHSCLSQAVQGYFLEESVTCTCSLSSDGHPRGTAQWYKAGQQVGSNGTLVVTLDKSNPEQIYTCEAVSDLGQRVGSTLTAKFAFIVSDSVEVESTPDTINICDNNTDQARVMCRISKDNVNPEPTFSFFSDGLKFDPSRAGTISKDGSYYQSQVSVSPDAGGEYQVTCRVTNTLSNTWQDKKTNITYRKPPPATPRITVGKDSYQGRNLSNIVNLTEGYSGHVTCRVQGGYPAARNTQLKCGQLVDTGARHTAALSFTADQLTREMNGAVCSCTSQHDSSCYRNKETQLTLSVLYVPEVNFTLDQANTTFSKGDILKLKCSGQGNPEPTLTLTTNKTTEDLTNVQTTELTHTLTLDCMGTGVYVCSGHNSQGTSTTEISIGVRCPQQLSPLFNSKPQVDAVIRETAEFGIEIYGFPEPNTLTLQRTDDATNLISSPRHSVEYTAGVAPFGVVNVTISDVVEADYTNYTLTVDNGVGNALIYTFYLNEVNASNPESSGDIYIIVGICVGLAVLILVAVAVVVLYRRKNKSGKSAETGSILKEPDYVEKTNEVYGASNDVKSKAENGDVFRKSDIDLKRNPVYVSSGEAQAENGVAQRESDCVMKENIVYGTSSEAQDGDRNEVIHKNPVYGSHFPYPGRKGTVKQSRDYTQLEPTITSASAAPANMKMATPEDDADPYEDVGNVKKSKPLGKSKQSVAPKPSPRGMAPHKPGSSPTFQVQQVGSSDEPYAMVSLTNKGNKRTATPEPDEEEQDKDFLPDPSTRPDVPVKQFEEGDARARGSDIPEQPYGNFQSVQAETSESDKSHTNGSFLPDETEDNVYANTGAVGMRS